MFLWIYVFNLLVNIKKYEDFKSGMRRLSYT